MQKVVLAYSGGLVEYSSVPAPLLIPIPDDVDPSTWGLEIPEA
jgi:hypothetical protein